MHGRPGSLESRFLGTANLLRRTNPLTYLAPGLPSFLIQHSSDDDQGSVEQSMLLARGLRGVLPETDVRFDVIPGSVHGRPTFETEENIARVFAFLPAALALSGKAALDPGELSL